MRLTRYQRTVIFRAILAEAHAKTARKLTGQDFTRAVEHVKRNIFGAAKQELTVTSLPASSRQSGALIPHPTQQETRITYVSETVKSSVYVAPTYTQGGRAPMHMQGTVTPNSRYIELRYETPKGFATPHFHPSEEEQLEKKLISLRRRHIEATVINLLTGEVVGNVESGDSLNPWIWWYDPAGIDAKEAPPAQARTIVSSVANEQDARGKRTRNAETGVSA